MEIDYLSRTLASLLSRGGSFADLFIEETESTSIFCEEDKIEQVLTGSDRGVGLRLIQDFQTFYGSSSDLSLPTIQDLASSLA
ncbi:MAG: DNA gyrase modulator, partial [candidate division NC10 bacterium]|nr:DNA gyrase modulator [candidate division NC10 bacterium]